MGEAIVELNVGGHNYTTTLDTLKKANESQLARWFQDWPTCPLAKDRDGRHFVDRDGQLFRFVLDFLRTGRLRLPDRFNERSRLVAEAQFYGLQPLTQLLGAAEDDSGAPLSASQLDLNTNSSRNGYVTLGYQGSFSFGRQGMGAGDINFRKVSRILICGRVSLCREVFGESVNEGRDPDRGHSDRYTTRFYLKHNFIEMAFDQLSEAGFRMVGSCASGTSGPVDTKPGSNTEEERWAHYNEFVFVRD